ncbi:hypothetical protein JAAARDRAFT_46825 [Jaapia argillacea MUCL 33604]|uniref:Ribonuclease H1 N-terminal domain-containing protein n=1 Tax=Jaapia argillacea MUCL 33604 TaxID=933084 RepID=A0A067PWS5_9AGAM|nr:hypothetical protein JAAARDRAFT_46825 [Jaapia argillacea MUCL 33604]
MTATSSEECYWVLLGKEYNGIYQEKNRPYLSCKLTTSGWPLAIRTYTSTEADSIHQALQPIAEHCIEHGQNAEDIVARFITNEVVARALPAREYYAVLIGRNPGIYRRFQDLDGCFFGFQNPRWYKRTTFSAAVECMLLKMKHRDFRGEAQYREELENRLRTPVLGLKEVSSLRLGSARMASWPVRMSGARTTALGTAGTPEGTSLRLDGHDSDDDIEIVAPIPCTPRRNMAPHVAITPQRTTTQNSINMEISGIVRTINQAEAGSNRREYRPDLGRRANAFVDALGYTIEALNHIIFVYQNTNTAEDFAASLASAGMPVVEALYLYDLLPPRL